MASISSLGVGSGLDAETIITKLMTLEKVPISNLQKDQDGLKTQLSAVGTLKSQLSTLQDKARALSSLTLWSQTTASTSDATIASATSGTGTPTGSYAVSVQALAAQQTVTSSALASSATAVGEGTLTLQLGRWSGSSFTAKAGTSATTLTIGPGETSLSAIRDKINGAGMGVVATIVNDASGARLSLRSKDSGEVNGFRITASETTDDGDPATGLSMLAYNPADASNPTTLNQAAANAQATINGIQVSSPSNTLTEVVDGMSLTLNKVSATPAQITVASDTSAIKTAVNDFVSAFNTLSSNLQNNLKYDAATKKAGTLQGDGAAINLQWALRGVLNLPSTASSSYSTLSDVGISMKQDGTLQVTASKLDSALSNQTELKKLLSTSGNDKASSGFMARFNQLASNLLGTDGTIATRESGLQASIQRNQKQQDTYTDRLTATEARLRAQYQALDTKMASLSALSSYVTQQFSSSSK